MMQDATALDATEDPNTQLPDHAAAAEQHVLPSAPSSPAQGMETETSSGSLEDPLLVRSSSMQAEDGSTLQPHSSQKQKPAAASKGPGVEPVASVKACEQTCGGSDVGAPGALDKFKQLEGALESLLEQQKALDAAASHLSSVLDEWGKEEMTIEKLNETKVGKFMTVIMANVKPIISFQQNIIQTLTTSRDRSADLKDDWMVRLGFKKSKTEGHAADGLAQTVEVPSSSCQDDKTQQTHETRRTTEAQQMKSTHVGGNAGSTQIGGNAGSTQIGGNAGSTHIGGNAGSTHIGGNAGGTHGHNSAVKARAAVTDVNGGVPASHKAGESAGGYAVANGKLQEDAAKGTTPFIGANAVKKEENGEGLAAASGAPSADPQPNPNFLNLLASLACNGQPLAFPKTGDPTRDKAVAMLTVCLTPMFPIAPASLACSIEQALLNQHGQDGLPSLAYKLRLKQLWTLMGPDSKVGHQLRQLILAGCLVPEQVVLLPEEDLLYKAEHQDQQGARAIRTLLVGIPTTEQSTQADVPLSNMKATCTPQPVSLSKQPDAADAIVPDSSLKARERTPREASAGTGSFSAGEQGVRESEGWENGNKRTYRQLLKQEESISRGSDPIVDSVEPPSKIPRTDGATPSTVSQTPGITHTAAVGRGGRWEAVVEPQHTPGAKPALPADSAPAHLVPAVVAAAHGGREVVMVDVSVAGVPATALVTQHSAQTPTGDYHGSGSGTAWGGPATSTVLVSHPSQRPGSAPWSDGHTAAVAAVAEDGTVYATVSHSQHAQHPPDVRGREMTHTYSSKGGSRSYGHDKDGYQKGERGWGEHSSGRGQGYVVKADDAGRVSSHAEAGSLDHQPSWGTQQYHAPDAYTPGDSYYSAHTHHEGSRDGRVADYSRHHDYHGDGQSHNRYGYDREGGRGGYGGRYSRRGGRYGGRHGRDDREHASGSSYSGRAQDPRIHTHTYAPLPEAAAPPHPGAPPYAAAARAEELAPHAYTQHATVAIVTDGPAAARPHSQFSSHRPAPVSVPSSTGWPPPEVPVVLPPPRTTPGPHGPMRRSEDQPSPATALTPGGSIPAHPTPPAPVSTHAQHTTSSVAHAVAVIHTPIHGPSPNTAAGSVPRVSKPPAHSAPPVPSPRVPITAHHAANPSPPLPQHSKAHVPSAHALSPPEYSFHDPHSASMRRADSAHSEGGVPVVVHHAAHPYSETVVSGAPLSGSAGSTRMAPKHVVAIPSSVLGAAGPPPPPVPPRSSTTIPLIPSQVISAYLPPASKPE